MDILCKIRFFMKMLTEIKIVVFFPVFGTLSAKHPKTIPGTLTVAPHPSNGPERNLAAGNLDPHRASGT